MGVLRALLGAVASLTWGKCFLMCYVIWYVIVIGTHFPHDPVVWINAVMLAAVVGVALNLNAYPGGKGPGATMRYIDSHKWMIVRFFIIPFMVATYAAAAATNESSFVALVPKDLYILGAMVTSAVAWLMFMLAVKEVHSYMFPVATVGTPSFAQLDRRSASPGEAEAADGDDLLLEEDEGDAYAVQFEHAEERGGHLLQELDSFPASVRDDV